MLARITSTVHSTLALLVATLAAAWPAAAQSNDVDPFHWGYAAAFGRGLYRLGDGTRAEIYRAQFKPPLRRAADADEGRGPGVRLVLPVTVGLQGVDEESLPLDRPADRVELVSFLPGVELEFAPTKRLTLRTTVQGGRGEELEGAEQTATLASFGVRSRLKFVDAPARPALITGLQWAGYNPSEGERRSLLKLTMGIELDIAARSWQVRGHPVRWLPHVLEDRFFRPPPALAWGNAADAGSGALEREQQIGVAVGRDEPFKIWFFEFDAVGLAYRFSEHSNGIRLYLNSVF